MTGLGPRPRDSIRAVLMSAAALACGLAAAPVLGAIPPYATERESPLRFRQADETVLRIQKALSAIGLYVGPVDGRMNAQTEAAIKVFQRLRGLKADGVASENIANLLDTGEKVGELLDRLEKARREDVDAARKALLAHPATRDLVLGAGEEAADPTRDPAPCFREPTVRCLLTEAVESSKAIPKTELRDWALGEILAAQAKAGLGREALETVRRIGDPRLIMVALRDIAEGQAVGGRAAEALAAAEIIPDLTKKTEAYAAVGDLLARHGRKDAAATAVARMLALADDLGDPVQRVQFRAKAATVLALAGDEAGAGRELAAAERLARDETPPQAVGRALRHVAAAMAELRDTERAMAILKDVPDESDRVTVLMTTATRQADAGDAAAALAIADSIEEVRYRAVVLGRIAVAQARAGDTAAADTTIETALAAVDRIKMPYARSYAVAKIALSLADIGAGNTAAFDRAAETAERIGDAQMRAQTLWTVAAARARAGDTDGAAKTEALAEDATAAIKSTVNRVWMFGDVALQRAFEGSPEAAWRAFDRGLAAAETVTNAWGRARVLARLAQTLVHLVAAAPLDASAKR